MGAGEGTRDPVAPQVSQLTSRGMGALRGWPTAAPAHPLVYAYGAAGVAGGAEKISTVVPSLGSRQPAFNRLELEKNVTNW